MINRSIGISKRDEFLIEFTVRERWLTDYKNIANTINEYFEELCLNIQHCHICEYDMNMMLMLVSTLLLFSTIITVHY